MGLAGTLAIAWLLWPSGPPDEAPGPVLSTTGSTPITTNHGAGNEQAASSPAAAPVVSAVARGPGNAPRRPPVDPLADDPPPLPAPPVTEREHHAAFLALAQAQGPAALGPVAEALVGSEAPRPRKTAVLMALFEVGTPDAAWIAARFVSEEPDVSGPAAVSLPVLAVQRLEAGAAHDPQCRAVLLGVVDGRVPTDNGSLRQAAAACLARVGDAAELVRLSSALQAEQDTSVLAGVARALRENPAADDAAHAFGGLLPEVARIDNDPGDAP